MKIIKFSAMWCPSCLIMNSRIEQIKNEYNLELIEYDYDIDSDKVDEYNVGEVLPVIIFTDNNKEVKRIIGEISAKELKKVVGELQ